MAIEAGADRAPAPAPVSYAPRLILRAEAARQLGLDIRNVNKLIDSGTLESVQFPGLRPRVSQASVDELLARMAGA